MPCQEPRTAWQPALGGALKFIQPNSPRAYTQTHIPCGNCILCRQEQARQWGVRITHEAQRWEESSFITLTYSEKHLPAYGSLNYEDLVKFWKRLRKNHGSIRYYAVGEYGDKTQRPHYHACLFGTAFTNNRIVLREKPTLLWTNPELEKEWGLGSVSVGALNFQTAQYTASYVLKKLKTGQKYVRIDEETGELIELAQPRPFMSKNLGKEWWSAYQDQLIAHDQIVLNGRTQKPPKQYDRWLEQRRTDFVVSPGGTAWRGADTRQKQIAKIKEMRKKTVEKLRPEQNRARARNAHARAQRKSKSV